MPEETQQEMATLYNPTTGAREAVSVGSEQAQNLFGQGYFLETSYNPQTGLSTYDQPTLPATQENPQGDAVEYVYVQRGDQTMKINKNELPNFTSQGYNTITEQQYYGTPSGTTTTETTTDTTTESQSEDEIAYQQASDDLIKEREQIDQNLDNFSATLDENTKAIIENIKQRYEVRRGQMESINKATLAGLTKTGIRSGRERYASEIQSGILSSEERAGIQRLAQLDNEEQSLILEAEMAKTEKQFALLQTKSENLLEIQKQKMQTILDLNNMAYQEEQRAQNRLTFERTKKEWAKEDATTRLESMITGGIDLNSLTDEEYTKLETELGLESGTLEGFYTGLMDARNAKAIGDNIALQKSIFDLLNSVPDGMEVTIGDSTYKGLKDTVDRYMYTEIIGNTKYEVAVDKKTGKELWRKSAGQAYKSTSGPAPAKVTESMAKTLGIPISYIGTAIKDLPDEYKNMVLDGEEEELTDAERRTGLMEYLNENNAFGEDGKVSWETYLAMKQTWINNNGDEKSFKTNFPINQYLDEGNQEEYNNYEE